MKELVVGDVSLYSEDDDSWDDLIKVVRKANKAYLEYIEDLKSAKKQSWIKKFSGKIQDLLMSNRYINKENDKQ